MTDAQMATIDALRSDGWPDLPWGGEDAFAGMVALDLGGLYTMSARVLPTGVEVMLIGGGDESYVSCLSGAVDTIGAWERMHSERAKAAHMVASRLCAMGRRST